MPKTPHERHLDRERRKLTKKVEAPFVQAAKDRAEAEKALRIAEAFNNMAQEALEVAELLADGWTKLEGHQPLARPQAVEVGTGRRLRGSQAGQWAVDLERSLYFREYAYTRSYARQSLPIINVDYADTEMRALALQLEHVEQNGVYSAFVSRWDNYTDTYRHKSGAMIQRQSVNSKETNKLVDQWTWRTAHEDQWSFADSRLEALERAWLGSIDLGKFPLAPPKSVWDHLEEDL